MITYRRVVFDTSTLVSAALRVGSVPHRALVHALARRELCASASTLAELESVLQRDKFDRYLSAALRAEFAGIIRRRASFFEVTDADLELTQHPARLQTQPNPGQTDLDMHEYRHQDRSTKHA